MQAVEKALHHPLLDSIPLDEATGIIANFTGGNDLTFQEIAERYRTCRPKPITAPRSSRRHERLAYGKPCAGDHGLTGLGATPVEQPVMARPQKETAPAEPAMAETATTHDTAPTTAQPASRERSHIEFMPSPPIWTCRPSCAAGFAKRTGTNGPSDP
jgi:cell division protein FtsZ